MSYQSRKHQITPEDKALEIAEKGKRKDAKNVRKTARRQAIRATRNAEDEAIRATRNAEDDARHGIFPKTQYQIFQENPNAFWEKIQLLRSQCVDEIGSIQHKFDSVKDHILSITTESDHNYMDIDNAFMHLNTLNHYCELMITKRIKANNLLLEANKFHVESQIVPTEVQRCLLPLEEQPDTHSIMQFCIFHKERLCDCKRNAIVRDQKKVPFDFVNYLIMMFPQTIHQNKIIICVFINYLVGNIKIKTPICSTAITVRNHIQTQDRINHNIDGSIAVLAKNCANTSNCLDCSGIQSWNIVRLYKSGISQHAINKMLISLLNGHETALEAFCHFLMMKCNKQFENDSRNRIRCEEVIRIVSYPVCLERISSEYRFEIVNLLLTKLGISIIEVNQHIEMLLQ